MESHALLVGWHFAGVVSDVPPDRPEFPEWLDVRQAFDEWLLSEPDGIAPGTIAPEHAIPPEQLDVMIAYGWKDVDDD